MRANRGELFNSALAFCLVVVLGLSVAATPSWAGEAVKHYNLGIDYSNKGQWDAAIASWKEAIRLKRGYVNAHYNLGIAYQKKRQFDAAIASYKETIRLKPDYTSAHTNLGGVYTQNGQYDLAITSLKKAIRLKPGRMNTHVILGIAYARNGDRKAALVEYEWLKTRWPRDADVVLAETKKYPAK